MSPDDHERPGARLRSTTLRVTDLDRSLAFYTGLLGMRLLRRGDDAKGHSMLAVVGYGKEDTHAVIELTRDWAEQARDHEASFGHLAIGVADAGEMCEALRAAGVDIGRPPDPMTTDPHEVLASVRDPDGYRIALVQDARPPSAADGDLELSNYLFFTRDCEAALRFYEACGLGRMTEILRYGQDGMPVTNDTMLGKVMHARFAGPGVSFYASDNDDAEPMRGSAHILMLHDAVRTRALFARLSEGGRVTTPLAIQPWGDFYGKLTDRFGVQWMLNCVKDLRRAK